MRVSFFILFIVWATALFSQSREFHATFKSYADGEEILYAKVNNGTGITRLTNIDGEISMPFAEGAIITVTHLNYDSLVIKTDDFIGRDSVIFYMTPKTYELKEVTFSVLGERAFFDSKFVNNDLGIRDAQKVRDKLGLGDMKQELIGLDRAAQNGAVLGSPISYLYNKFSKEGKDRARYAELVRQDQKRKALDKKLDDYMITSLSGFEGESLDEFKKFCSFHPSYIIQAETLEIFFEVLRCKEEYTRQEETNEP